MSIKSRFKNFFALDDEYEYEEEEEHYPEEEEYEAPRSAKQVTKNNIVSLQSVKNSTSSKVVLFEPRVYAEAQEIADHLKSKKAVVVNLQRISIDQAKRIVDFLSGTVYAIGGDIQKIGPNIVLCTPDNIDVSGTISELSSEDDFSGKRW